MHYYDSLIGPKVAVIVPGQ